MCTLGTVCGPTATAPRQGQPDQAMVPPSPEVPTTTTTTPPPDTVAFDQTSLTPDTVMAKISSEYMTGLKSCYLDYLAKDATARGRVTLSFTVDETGQAMTNRAQSDALPGVVTTCIEALMAGWTFAIPKDDEGPTTADFRVSLQLVPE